MRKRFKTKKRAKHKLIFFTIILFSLMSLFNYFEKSISISIPNIKTIDRIFKSGNNYSYDEIENVYLSNELYKYLSENIFNSPLNLLKSEIEYDMDSKETISFSYAENKAPIVYIYNSHQGETYSMKYLEDYNIVPNILMASNMLKDKLENIGISTVVEENDILKYMEEHNLNHGGSYIASRYFLTKIMNKYPNLKLYIDIHRDATTHDISTTTINGKDYARVLFVIGLEYSTYENNLTVVNKLNNIIIKNYPTLSRGIMKKSGYGVNGVYNQDLASNVILIEIGGNENNIEEVNNTLDVVAKVIGEYLNEKK